jgi:hypothetical protein
MVNFDMLGIDIFEFQHAEVEEGPLDGGELFQTLRWIFALHDGFVGVSEEFLGQALALSASPFKIAFGQQFEPRKSTCCKYREDTTWWKV